MASPMPVAPIPVSIAAPTPVEGFTEPKWKTLFALLDAVTPSIVTEDELTDGQNQLRITEAQCREAYEQTKKDVIDPPDYAKFKEYLSSRPAANPKYQEHIRRLVGNLPKAAQQDLNRLLALLDTKIGSIATTGHCLSVKDQPVHVRQAIFQSWDSSRINFFAMLSRTFFMMGRMSFSSVDPLFREMIEYEDHDEGYKPGDAFDYNFMQFPAGEEPVNLEFDVVIVGSGCGGGVCAKNLAEAGHRVLVVDRGYYFPPSQLPLPAGQAFEYLFESKGFIQTDDQSISLVAGSTWGGGGTVNWSVSLHPQGFVRQEWADAGLPFFLTQEFQRCLDRVCEFMGVSDQNIRHNSAANIVLEGSRKLGWHAKTCPQNTGGAEHYCGRCHHGCGSGEKGGPAVTWLPAASRASARFIEGIRVDKVLFDERAGKKHAAGIVGTWTARGKDGRLDTPESERIQRTIKVNAKKVIVSCGTLQSPLLLLRSGLKNHQIGKNLYLHPAASVRATYDREIKGWEGGIITSVCTSFENLDGKGHGVKIEPNVMMPHIAAAELTWKDGMQWKLDALRMRQMTNHISILRDRDTGRVYPDPHDGRPLIAYTLSNFDRANSLAGIIAICKLVYVEGATEIWSNVPGVPSFKRKAPSIKQTGESEGEEESFDHGVNDADFAAWIRLLEKTGMKSPRATWMCAHQMGSCRMSAKPGDGVVDPRGQVWGVDGLFVADASIFPSASGVNPMVTNMAIADYISRGISKELKSENGVRASL
ncbi:GMC oxidoreductase [Xylariaceae sp. FL0255]|nr:GMC oxidoreductase [Xylariaceae sp. FL0255]